MKDRTPDPWSLSSAAVSTADVPEPLKVLIVEDNPGDAGLLTRALQQDGFDPHWQRVETEPDFLAALASHPDVARFVNWIRKKSDGFRPSNQPSVSKRVEANRFL